ncbi:hypothetical protein PR202_gb23313 [Eleusine coracana subsp. coracana]|uniref:Uncharacterized protein n=1 Tax=Eleusine coracana subsp. coracana TaxID=191504 RepID=A0AAV5FJ34_ELECO|nr:hypothetical protein PR202_gb23313 [Eleusine coracana subsp. coracana]
MPMRRHHRWHHTLAARRGLSPFFLHVTVPTRDDGEEEELEEIAAASTTSSSPSPPRRNACMRVGGRGRPTERMAVRHAPDATSSSMSPDLVVITGSEQPELPAPSAHTPNRGRLLQRHAHLAGTPPRHPGREGGAWASTARRALLPNGVDHELSSDEESPSGR